MRQLTGNVLQDVAAAIVPPALEPRTSTDAPSVMSLSNGPDALTNVDALVVTVNGWPLAVLMTRLVPFTCCSIPSVCSSWVHPVTEARVAWVL